MRSAYKISALALSAIVALVSSTTVFGAVAGESVSYSSWGNKTVCDALGIDTGEYYKWIVNHDNDSSNDYRTYTTAKNYDSSTGTDYYLGTKYTSGDHRTPNGDTRGYFSTDLYSPSSGYYCVGYGRQDELNGSSYKPQMNCTGFVWHVLYKSFANTKAQKGQSVSYAYANTHIPTYSYAPYDTGQVTWINWAENNGIKTYYFDGTNAINNVLNSGVLEKGDIIFLLGTEDAHVGIFYGNSSGNNKFWHSQYRNINTITNIEPRGTCYGLYVYKTGCSNGIDLNIQLNSTESCLNGSAYDFSNFEYTVYADSDCKREVGKIVPQSNGFGAFGLSSAEQYSSSSATARGVPVAKASYWCKETKSPNGYVVDGTVYKFEKSTLSWGGTARYYAGVAINENNHSYKIINKVPKLALRIENVSANAELTDNNENYSLENAIYELYNSDDIFCGYMKTASNGWVCATSAKKTDDIGSIEWSEGDYNSAFYLPYGEYYVKQIVAPKGFKLANEKITLNSTYKYTWSGLTVRYAQVSCEPIIFDASSVKVNLVNESNIPIGNAKLELYSDKACTQLVASTITDESGIGIFNYIKTGTYYIRQKAMPAGYFADENTVEVIVSEENIGGFSDAFMIAVSKGDINNDDIININDITIMQLFVADEKDTDGSDFINISDKHSFDNADIDGNGIINVKDITQLQIIISQNKV